MRNSIILSSRISAAVFTLISRFLDAIFRRFLSFLWDNFWQTIHKLQSTGVLTALVTGTAGRASVCGVSVDGCGTGTSDCCCLNSTLAKFVLLVYVWKHFRWYEIGDSVVSVVRSLSYTSSRLISEARFTLSVPFSPTVSFSSVALWQIMHLARLRDGLCRFFAGLWFCAMAVIKGMLHHKQKLMHKSTIQTAHSIKSFNRKKIEWGCLRK